MNPTQKAALLQLVELSIVEGQYSREDVEAETIILEGSSQWDHEFPWTPDHTENGVYSAEIVRYLSIGHLYKTFNL